MTAVQLLAAGYDSPALRESAGMPTADVVEVREVFVRALTQLGVYVSSREQAQTVQLRRWVQDALDGRLTRADLSVRVGLIWRVRDLVHNDLLPTAVFALVRACLSDNYWVGDAEFVRTLRQAGQDLA